MTITILAGAKFFTGAKPGPWETHYGLMGGAYQARDRELAPDTWARLVAKAVDDYGVVSQGVTLLWSHEFAEPTGDGSIGEVELRYNAAGHQAIIGLYEDGHLETWAD